MVLGSGGVIVSVNDNLDDVILLQLKPCIGCGSSNYVCVEIVQPSFTRGNSKDACSTIVSKRIEKRGDASYISVLSSC